MGKLKGSTLQVSSFLNEFEKDEVKRKVDIVDLFQSFGVDLEKKGSAFMGLCPFHEDKNPSLSVDKEKGLFHCFGCGASGDTFDLVMREKGISFKEALDYLKGGNIAPLKQAPKKSVKKEVKQPALTSISLDAIADFYSSELEKSEEAKSYLEERTLWNVQLIKRFRIGFCSGSLKMKVSEKQFAELTAIGIFNDKGKEAFTDCVVFPLLDSTGKVVSFYGRKVSPKARIKHLYLKGSHRGVFNGEAFRVYPERIIFTESVIDALSLIIMGVQNVIPIYGTNGITDDHFLRMKEKRTKEIVLAFDNDTAGKEASKKVTGDLNEEGYPVRSVFPGKKDWNEVLQTSPLDKSSFDELILSSSLSSPREKIKVEVKQDRYHFDLNGIQYRLSGVKEGFVSSLRVNIRAEKDGLKHIDNVDLFSARSRNSFSYSLARLFDSEAVRIEKDLISILEYLEEDRDRKLFSVDSSEQKPLTPEEEQAGLELLQDENLFQRIEDDLTALGYVGEAINKRLMYLAASSRKTDDPISVIVISQSSAGKSYLIDTVKKLIPDEDVLSMTSLSDQALNYLPDESLLHKFMVLGEAVHSEAIDHQMREMLSGKELSRLVTTKDEKTGKMVSRLVRKKVIVSAVMSSTSTEINPENASRCFVISTDESEEQTRAIHQRQRSKYSQVNFSKKDSDLPAIIEAHHAAQCLLENRKIINPFADLLDFPATLMRSRRDHERFMDLIASVCYLRQFQKEIKDQDGFSYIECDLEDYRIAYQIMVKILPSTLSNFPMSANLLYERIRKRIREKAKEEGFAFHEVSITQREIRESEGFEHNFVKRNIRTLVEYEYLTMKGGRSRGTRARYSLNQDSPLSFYDLSQIPSPEELENRVKSGSDSENVVNLSLVKS